MMNDPRLQRQVQEHPYPLLFATISGAHLYGFPSPDSDYDLRGVHLLPLEEVVGLKTSQETVEKSGVHDGLEIDLVTHDARKFFGLLLKKNGYVLEQVLSPLVVHSTPEHAELKEIAKNCITRHHAHHYLGFAETQWKLFQKEDPPHVKPLLYVYRVLLTGIHLMRTGEVQANLGRLNESFKLAYIPELIDRKVGGTEKGRLEKADLGFHQREFERMRAELEQAYQVCKLPEAPSGAAALHDLLVRVRFRTRLYEVVERKPFVDSPWLGEEEIIELDGVSALVFAINVRGRGMANREWAWDDERLIEQSIERLGEGPVSQLLDNATDEAVCEFQRMWRQRMKEKAEQEPAISHKERVRAITVAEIVAAAESEDTGFGMFRGGGMHADPTDLGIVLQRLWAAQEPKVIAKFLTVFSNRALPDFDARLIELCQHSDAEVRQRAFRALEKNAHRLIREFALAELAKGVSDGSVVGLFINNYEQGDERRILEAMEFPADECELHWLLMDVNKVLEKNSQADV